MVALGCIYTVCGICWWCLHPSLCQHVFGTVARITMWLISGIVITGGVDSASTSRISTIISAWVLHFLVQGQIHQITGTTVTQYEMPSTKEGHISWSLPAIAEDFIYPFKKEKHMARTKGAVAKGVDNKIVRDYLLAHGPLRNQKQVVDDSIRGRKVRKRNRIDTRTRGSLLC